VTRLARCGHPMRFREMPGWPAVLDPPVCGRRAGHKDSRGHVSETALEMARQRKQAPSGSPEVARVIREARKRAGMPQRHLARLAGVTEVCVQLWERAARMPSAESWVQLELTLGPLGVVREQPQEDAATREGQEAAA
jgi:ribosome-binding protein aMBF1 (putative translation factor)